MMGVLGGNNYSSVGSPTPKTQAKIVALDDSTFTALGPNKTGM
jgi:4-coumarate--CoA ligase